MQVILASGSPRRRELIKKLKFVQAEVVVSDSDESSNEILPEKLTVDLAIKKARAVFAKTGGIVIGADTVVAVDGKILGKPKNEMEAREFFKLLCGRAHEVFTGIAVISEQKSIAKAIKTSVTFSAYDENLVSSYIASGAPYDKAGGYGIQDEEIAPLIKGIEGDLDNVIGLPVAELGAILKENF